jgi:hypothetical protein
MRPSDWGSREKHPLYGLWNWHKNKNRYGMVEAWSSDFWTFASSVGDRPSDRHSLRRLKPHEPIGPDNFVWSERYFDGDRAAYMREYRKRQPERVRNTTLKKHFGIDLNDYNVMLSAQGGVCAICRCEQKGKTHLCVDHCHRTGTIRGLLCHNCNRAIGLLKDDHDVIVRAARYLLLSEAE